VSARRTISLELDAAEAEELNRAIPVMVRLVDLADEIVVAASGGDRETLRRAIRDYHAFRVEHASMQ